MSGRIRRTIGEYNFAGQYQLSPAPLVGGLVKANWFRRYRENEVPERFDRIVQSWDTANKATELSDFSVCTTWGVKDKNLFLLGVFRRRLEYPALKRAVCEQQSLFDPGSEAADAAADHRDPEWRGQRLFVACQSASASCGFEIAGSMISPCLPVLAVNSMT